MSTPAQSWQWRWVIPAALIPGVIVNFMHPHLPPALRIVSSVMLVLIVTMLGYARMALS